MAHINIGEKVLYDGRVYTIVSKDNNGVLTATAHENEWGGIPTIWADAEHFSNLMKV